MVEDKADRLCDRPTCPGLTVLRSYSSGLLSEAEVEQVEQCASECGLCEETLCRLDSETDPLIAQLRDAANRSEQPTDDTILNRLIEQAVQTSTCSKDMQDDSLPDRFGDYEVRERIAVGGMGSIARVWDPQLRRELAVKTLPRSALREPSRIHRFINESRISGILEHPGIVPVHQMGTLDDGRPYLVMRLIRGETLAALLAGRENPSDDQPHFLQVFEQVCQAVAYAHSRGIMHRDLKPLNVMVGQFGEVQVLDWGLARRISKMSSDATDDAAPQDLPAQANDASIASFHTEGPLGTLAFMPPEQARGDVQLMDQRSDVFSLGAILCTLLTGHPPYQIADRATMLETAQQGELGYAHQLLNSSDIDPTLRDLTLTCLSAQPVARPRDAGELAERIEKHRTDVQQRVRQAELERAEAIATTAEERKRRRITLALGTVIVGTLLTGLVATSLLWQRASFAESQQRELLGQLSEEVIKKHIERGEWQIALDRIDELLKHPGPSVDAHQLRLQRIRVWMTMSGRGDDIRREISALNAMSLPPAQKANLDLLAGDYYLGRDEAKAVSHLQNAIADTSLSEVDRHFAQGHLAANVPEALRHYTAAFQADPNHQAARFHACCLLIVEGKFAEAERQISAGQAIFPHDPQFKVLSSLAVAATGDSTTARRQLNELKSTLSQADYSLTTMWIDMFDSLHDFSGAMMNISTGSVGLMKKLRLLKAMAALGQWLPSPLQNAGDGVLRFPPLMKNVLTCHVQTLMEYRKGGTQVPDTQVLTLSHQARELNPEDGASLFLDAFLRWMELVGSGRWNDDDVVPQLYELENDFARAAQIPGIVDVRVIALDNAMSIASSLDQPWRSEPDPDGSERAYRYLRDRLVSRRLLPEDRVGDRIGIFVSIAKNHGDEALATYLESEAKRL